MFAAPARADALSTDLAPIPAQPLRSPSRRGSTRDAQIHRHLRLVTGAPPEWPPEPGTHVAPKRSVFICHTLRCGSTLLCDALSRTGVAGYPEEYFPERSRDGSLYVLTGAALKDPSTWQCDWMRTPFEDCLKRVYRCGTSSNGVFASKVKWLNIPGLSQALGGLAGHPSLDERLGVLFPRLQYVWVRRRDKVRQAVSLAKARQSAQWKVMSASEQQPYTAEYNFYAIDFALRRIVREESAWEAYFMHAGIAPLTVVYEDFIGNYESTVRRLMEDLNISLPNEYAFPAPRLHKQADAVSEEWVERYYRDARRSRARRAATNVPPLLLRPRLRASYVAPHVRRRIHRVRLDRANLVSGVQARH